MSPKPKPAKAAPSRAAKPKKVVVAVHGIGDQKPYETLRALVNQYTRTVKDLGTVALGRLYPRPGRAWVELPHLPSHWEDAVVSRRDLAESSLDKPRSGAAKPPHLGFAEVYWADLARDYWKGRLDEVGPWVRSIIDRMKRRAAYPNFRYLAAWAEPDIPPRYLAVSTYSRLYADALRRMSELVEDLPRFLPQLLPGTPDLKPLVNEYLGDVQLYAEYEPLRDAVLERFERKLAEVGAALDAYDEEHGPETPSEIHLVAHSLGTVIALHGLLRAIVRAEPPSWLGRVRTFVTLGSPIDKFFFLWPELVSAEERRANGLRPPAGRPRIRWLNFFDFNDPVGHLLDDARDPRLFPWIERFFDFREDDDVGFSRYALVGKAHTDYWKDDELLTSIAKATLWPGMPRRTAAGGAGYGGVERSDVWKVLSDPSLLAIFLFLASVGLVCGAFRFVAGAGGLAAAARSLGWLEAAGLALAAVYALKSAWHLIWLLDKFALTQKDPGARLWLPQGLEVKAAGLLLKAVGAVPFAVPLPEAALRRGRKLQRWSPD